MKVIDILNKIANGEEVPDKIKYRNKIFEYCDDDYFNDYFGYMFDSGTFNVFKILDDKIEIIEKDKPKTLNDIREMYGLPRIEDKKIEKLELTTTDGGENTIYMLLANKIDEIIDYLNKEHEW